MELFLGLGLSTDGQNEGTDSLLVLLPHQSPHGTTRIIKELSKAQSKAMRQNAGNQKRSAAQHPKAPGGHIVRLCKCLALGLATGNTCCNRN